MLMNEKNVDSILKFLSIVCWLDYEMLVLCWKVEADKHELAGAEHLQLENREDFNFMLTLSKINLKERKRGQSQVKLYL